MRSKNPKIFLEDILESIDRVEEYTENIELEEFLNDHEKQDAIIKRLEIIGEAAKNISDDIRKKYSEIPWKDMAGMRDVLVHEYFGISLERIWDTTINDIPKLRERITKLLSNY